MIIQKTFERSNTNTEEWIQLQTVEDTEFSKTGKVSFTMLSVADYANFFIWLKYRDDMVSYNANDVS